MADLEEHAFRRDKRFVVRLVLTLGVAFVGGLFMYGELTNQRTVGCAAKVVGGGDEAPRPSEPTSAP